MATQRTVELLKKSAVATTLAAEIENNLGKIIWYPIGDFGTEFTINDRNQVGFDVATKTYWAWLGELPHTVLSTDEPNTNDWKNVTQETLSALLSNPDKGAAMLGRGVVAVDSIADLLALPEGQRKKGLRYLVASYQDGWDGTLPNVDPRGGGEFFYDPDDTITPADGGTVFEVIGGGRFKRIPAGSSVSRDVFAEYNVQPIAEEIVIYCDPDNGDDSASGDLNDPLKTITAALKRVPFFIDNVRVEINLHSAPLARGALSAFYDEDVMVGPFVSGRTGAPADGESGGRGRLFIVGDQSDRTYVKIRSFTAVSCKGRDNPTLMWVRCASHSPYSESEPSAVLFTSCGSGSVWGISFDAGIETGVLSYNSTVDARQVDVTNCTMRGALAKRSGRMTCREFTGTYNPADPNHVDASLYDSIEGSYLTFWDDGVTIASGATRHQGRTGGQTLWSRQGGSRVGHGSSDFFPMDSYAKSGMSSDISVGDGVDRRLTFDTELFSNFIRAGNGVNEASRGLVTNLFLHGTFSVTVQATIQVPAGVTDLGDFELRIQTFTEEVVGKSSNLIPPTGGTSRTVTLIATATISPEGDPDLAKWHAFVANNAGATVTVLSDPVVTWFEMRRIA